MHAGPIARIDRRVDVSPTRVLPGNPVCTSGAELLASNVPNRRGYLAALVVNQICGAPFTPAFSIAAFNSAEAAKALAFSAFRKSCVTVTSFGLSIDR